MQIDDYTMGDVAFMDAQRNRQSLDECIKRIEAIEERVSLLENKIAACNWRKELTHEEQIPDC